MFFFVGGIQPKTVTLDETPKFCPACGLVQARLKRVDHYLSLFFIPLFPVKRGQAMLICDRCGTVSSGEPPDRESSSLPPANDRCRQCGARLDSSFRYCPQCGSRI